MISFFDTKGKINKLIYVFNYNLFNVNTCCQFTRWIKYAIHELDFYYYNDRQSGV